MCWLLSWARMASATFYSLCLCSARPIGGQSTRSWLLGGDWPARGIGGLIWLAALVGFVTVAVGLFNQTGWWRTAALLSAAVSIVGLLLFWSNPVPSPVFSALVFNLLLLASLLLFHWPPVAQAAG